MGCAAPVVTRPRIRSATVHLSFIREAPLRIFEKIYAVVIAWGFLVAVLLHVALLIRVSEWLKK